MNIKKFYKILLILNIFLLSQSSVAQKVKFDTKITYQRSFLDKKYLETILVNTSAQNKILEIRKDFQSYYAFLYDLKTMLKHKFEIKVINNNAEFVYAYSENIENSKDYYYNYEFKMLSNDSLYNYGELCRFKSKNKRKNARVDELKIIKNEHDFFLAYYFINKHDGEHLRTFDFQIGGIVEKATYFNGEVIVNVELLEFESINVVITIPKEIKIQKFYFK